MATTSDLYFIFIRIHALCVLFVFVSKNTSCVFKSFVFSRVNCKIDEPIKLIGIIGNTSSNEIVTQIKQMSTKSNRYICIYIYNKQAGGFFFFLITRNIIIQFEICARNERNFNEYTANTRTANSSVEYNTY